MIDWLDALIGLGIGMTLGVIAALLWSLSRRGERDHEFANLRARTELLTEQAGQHTEEIAVERTAREEAHARREAAELELATLKEQLKARQQQFPEQRGLLDEAIRLMRDASDIEPEKAWYRVKLAELLADNSLLQSAIDECWIADRLAPDWEQPRVSIGLFFNKAGRFEEAEKHLLATAAHLGRRTLNLSFNLGWAYLETGKPALALIELEAVLEERPEMGLALDMAAFCQFLTGDHVKGWRMAKRAKQLGFGAAYAAASSGEFRKPSKRRPHGPTPAAQDTKQVVRE